MSQPIQHKIRYEQIQVQLRPLTTRRLHLIGRMDHIIKREVESKTYSEYKYWNQQQILVFAEKQRIDSIIKGLNDELNVYDSYMYC